MTKLLPKGLSIITILGIVGLGGALYASHIVQAQEDTSCVAFESEITSDSQTMVNGISSVAVDNDTGTEGNQVPSAWTADIEGATWIWSDAQNDGAASPGTEVFTRDFMFSSDATSTAMLKIATDNTYEVRLNGVLMGSSVDDINFTSATQDQHDLSAELDEGLNTLEITVTNLDNGADNPAGLLYRLDLAGFECEDIDDGDEERDEKVFVCHLPGGDESKARTLHINSDSLEDHLAHGDHEGECENESESFDNRGNRGNDRR